MRDRSVAAPVSMLLALLAGGCQSTTKTVEPEYRPRQVVERNRWEVWSPDRQLGWLVELEILDPNGKLRFYRVENLRNQWVGHVTADGRFSRREPFRDDDVDLGLWPMRQGVAKLFEASGEVELRTWVEADTRKHDR